MDFIPDPQAAADWCHEQRRKGGQIGYVPTMGALHAGHDSLVKRSVPENDLTCCSIFVNPLQFDNPADLEKYPRDLTRDLDVLEHVGCDMVFTGTLASFFPEAESLDDIPQVDPLPAIAGLEAVSRPGHLEGVQAIVERLFHTVGKCRAYFGEKDFQQTLLVKQIAAAHGDITIVVCPTVRDASGLAMSSRNQRLDSSARQLALHLVQALRAADRQWQAGERNPAAIEVTMARELRRSGIQLEYAAVRDPDHWTADTPRGPLQKARALVAARIGGVRLIDNMALGESS